VAITLVPGLIAAFAVDFLRVSTPAFVAAVALVLLKSVPLWWRRRQPVPVLAIVAAALLASEVLRLSQTASDGAVIFAVYAVSVYGSSRARLWVVGLVAVFTLATFVTALAAVTPHRESLLTLGPPALVAWVVGDYIRGRRVFFIELITRHRRESEALRRAAVEEERLRIARELHDVVAHNVSVMAIQAGAARVSGSSSGEALKSIENTARETLAELNQLLGVLRKDPGAPARSPQPGLDQLNGLLTSARESGLDASLKSTGETRPLPAALDLSAYRIVQEAITNALKHSNATRLEVVIDHQPDALVLTISDNGTGASEKVGESTGHGLIGMRERVELFGGELGTGSSSLGGFTVRARLPIS
jgi:signal transduction histidine kinase